MLSKTKILNFLKNHRHELQNDFHIRQIGSIGSFARDEQSDSSDIDICRMKYIKPYIREYIENEAIYA